MQSIQAPLERLVRSLQWFTVARELRLLQVVTSADLRTTVLEHVAAAEHGGLNTTPFVVLEAPATADDGGWSVRCEELGEELAAIRGVASGAFASLTLPQPSRGAGGLKHFGETLGAMLRALPEQLTGITVVLAPLGVEDHARWASDLTALLGNRELEATRFIVVGEESPALRKARERLGELAELVDARVDPEAAQRDLAESLASMAAAPAGATGPRAVGAAGPRVAPPRRKTDPSGTVEERRAALAAAGVAPGLADPELSAELRANILGATQAMQAKDPVAAVRRLRRAVELCRDAGLVREAITIQLMLGSTVLQLAKPESAIPLFEEARVAAVKGEHHDLEVQAFIAQGLTLFLCQRHDEAASTYERAGRAGAMHGQTVLAIEGYRLCGQLLFTRNRIELAIQAWKKALELAESAPPDVASASSAPVVARTLAEACRKHGLKKQAESLEAQAAAFEAPPVPPAEQPVAPAAPAPQPAAKPKRETIAVTMNMLIEELFPPGDPQYKDFWEPPAEAPHSAAAVAAVPQRLGEPLPPRPTPHEPAKEPAAAPLLTDRPKKRDRAPTINFNVGQMSFRSSFVGGLMGFQPTFDASGRPSYTEGDDLFAPVDPSQFKREAGYERTVPLPDDPAASAEKWKHDPMPRKTPTVEVERPRRRLDPMAMTVFDPGATLTAAAKASKEGSKELDTVVVPPGIGGKPADDKGEE